MTALGLAYNPKDVSDHKSLSFWFRQACHFIGGALLGLIFCPFYAVFAAMLIKETIENAKTTKKEWSDVAAWTAGAAIGNTAIILIFI